MDHNDYAFHWKARFADGTVLSQFEPDGTENGFGKVQEKEDSLIYFWLELQNSAEPLNIGVSMVDGSFNINDFVLKVMKDDYGWDRYSPEFRVVNFRRVRQHFDPNAGNKGIDVDYFVGWQLTHEGKNYKKLLKLDSEGNWWIS